MSVRAFALALAGALAIACGASEPRVVVSVTGNGGADLVRLRWLLRECGESRFALLRDIDTNGPAPVDPFDAAVVPGRSFYVWIQAWESCTLAGPCPNENTSPAGTCLCFDGVPSEQ